MALRNYNPTSPGRRGLVLVNKSALWKGKPEKSLVEGQSGKGGRNNQGRITARRRGGGHKRRYRQIDFKRRKFDIPATVERIEYDPNRSAFIALLRYDDGERSYILAPQRIAIGDQVISGNQVDVKPGNAMPLTNTPIDAVTTAVVVARPTPTVPPVVRKPRKQPIIAIIQPNTIVFDRLSKTSEMVTTLITVWR